VATISTESTRLAQQAAELPFLPSVLLDIGGDEISKVVNPYFLVSLRQDPKPTVSKKFHCFARII
jgi:hypothetical protein